MRLVFLLVIEHSVLVVIETDTFLFCSRFMLGILTEFQSIKYIPLKDSLFVLFVKISTLFMNIFQKTY